MVLIYGDAPNACMRKICLFSADAIFFPLKAFLTVVALYVFHVMFDSSIFALFLGYVLHNIFWAMYSEFFCGAILFGAIYIEDV